jgi:flagellar biosynthesis/type III secretory pathway protein FliH
LAHWSQFLAFGAQKSEEEMAALTNNDPRIIDAYREFQQFTADPQTRELLRQRHMFLVDYHMALDDSKAEGHAEGHAEGYAEGSAETEAKWQEKWKAEKIETIGNLKLLGLDSKAIAKAMGLSLDEVEHLN